MASHDKLIINAYYIPHKLLSIQSSPHKRKRPKFADYYGIKCACCFLFVSFVMRRGAVFHLPS